MNSYLNLNFRLTGPFSVRFEIDPPSKKWQHIRLDEYPDTAKSFSQDVNCSSFSNQGPEHALGKVFLHHLQLPVSRARDESRKEFCFQLPIELN